nr:hypothetical protein [Tanacetum cinerariifolium]
TNLSDETISLIPSIVDAYLANKMSKAIKTAVQLQSNRLGDEAQAKNEDFINKLDENIKKIIMEQVKVQVKEKDDDEEISVGSNRGSKRSRARKEPESTSKPKEKTSKLTGKSIEGSKSHKKSTGKFAQTEEPIHTADDLEESAPQEFNAGNLLVMSTLGTKSLPLQSFRVSNGIGIKHLDWITVRRNNDKLYTFKEGDYKRLHLQDIEDTLSFITQGKLINLYIEERLALNVSL